MRAYARSQVEVPLVAGKSVIIEVTSSSNPNKTYKVDLTLGRCSCLGWTRHAKNGERKPCKHLRELGYVSLNTR